MARKSLHYRQMNEAAYGRLKMSCLYLTGFTNKRLLTAIHCILV